MGVKLGPIYSGKNTGRKGFANWVLEKIFGPERGESDSQLEKILHSVELCVLCCSPYIVLVVEMGVACGIYGAEEKFVQGLGEET